MAFDGTEKNDQNIFTWNRRKEPGTCVYQINARKQWDLFHIVRCFGICSWNLHRKIRNPKVQLHSALSPFQQLYCCVRLCVGRFHFIKVWEESNLGLCFSPIHRTLIGNPQPNLSLVNWRITTVPMKWNPDQFILRGLVGGDPSSCAIGSKQVRIENS